MSTNTNISIIQLIKSGDISVNYEISRIKAGEGIDIKIRSYLEKSDHYQEIQQHIKEAEIALKDAKSMTDKLHFGEKLENLKKVETDFISNTLYLAETLSKIEPRTDRLKKAIELFGKKPLNYLRPPKYEKRIKYYQRQIYLTTNLP